mmetsp:Transcript_23664/g.30933  ORF Transcript_23664/g.30933 Transcript_23664/m.30933 type:complete len:292 (+) Transcript_23664:161-1036(+)
MAESNSKKNRSVIQSKDESYTAKDAIFIVLFFAVIAGYFIHKTFPRTFISCSEDQKLLTRIPDFLPEEEFLHLKKQLMLHPHTTSRKHLANEPLPHTRGAVIMFNKEGIQEFRNNSVKDEMVYLQNFLDKVVLNETNAFVINVLICDPKPIENGVKHFGDIDDSVAAHLDGNVAIKSTHHTFLAHEVNVLYVNIPKDMEGGKLSVYPYSTGGPRWKAWYREQVKKPKENLLVTFRGDSYHAVSGYYTDTNEKRISLILEQYIIPEEYYHNTVRYAVDDYEHKHAVREHAEL